MRNDYFEHETAEKSFGFKVILAFVALMILSIIGFRIHGIVTYEGVALDPTLTPDPMWYNYTIIVLGLIALGGIIATWNFMKVGVYTVIVSLFLTIVLNPDFSLVKTIAPMFTLFVFSGYGLFEIIPKWRFFK